MGGAYSTTDEHSGGQRSENNVRNDVQNTEARPGTSITGQIQQTVQASVPCSARSKSKSEKVKATEPETDTISTNSIIICRICYDTEDTYFVSPCKCKGTMGLVHKHCLEKWLIESGRNSCELCGASYPSERHLRYSAGNSLYIWFLTRHKLSFVHYTYMRYLRTDIIICVVLTILLIVCIYFCIFGADHYMTYQTNSDWPASNKWTCVSLFLVIVILTGGYYLWMYLTVRYHFRMWYWWWQHTVVVNVLAEPLDIKAYLKNIKEETQPPDKKKKTSSAKSESTAVQEEASVLSGRMPSTQSTRNTILTQPQGSTHQAQQGHTQSPSQGGSKQAQSQGHIIQLENLVFQKDNHYCKTRRNKVQPLIEDESSDLHSLKIQPCQHVCPHSVQSSSSRVMCVKTGESHSVPSII